MHSFDASRYSAKYEPYEHVRSLWCNHWMLEGIVQSMNPMNMFVQNAFIWCFKVQCKVWTLWTCLFRMHSFHGERYSAKYEPYEHVCSECIHLMLEGTVHFHCTSRRQMLASSTIGIHNGLLVISGCIHLMLEGTVQIMKHMNMFFQDAFISCLKVQCKVWTQWTCLFRMHSFDACTCFDFPLYL